jgi:ArsR family transcriptional regulator, zinc-responsive transcriptional repressor
MGSSDQSPPLPAAGDALLGVFQALANPHRLRVLQLLLDGRNYVSQIARELEISRALLQIHLRKLEQAGLVSSTLELSGDGKSMKFYEVVPFSWNLTPHIIGSAAATLTVANTWGEVDMADSGMWWTFGSLAFVFLFIAVILWPITSIWKSRAGLKKEQEYRDLSDRSLRTLEGYERESRELLSRVTNLNGRVEVLEKLLAEVDW